MIMSKHEALCPPFSSLALKALVQPGAKGERGDQGVPGNIIELLLPFQSIDHGLPSID